MSLNGHRFWTWRELSHLADAKLCWNWCSFNIWGVESPSGSVRVGVSSKWTSFLKSSHHFTWEIFVSLINFASFRTLPLVMTPRGAFWIRVSSKRTSFSNSARHFTLETETLPTLNNFVLFRYFIGRDTLWRFLDRSGFLKLTSFSDAPSNFTQNHSESGRKS